MEKWKNPQITDLNLSKTMGYGDLWICKECCKTSNTDKGTTPIASLHNGGCSGHPSSKPKPTEEYSRNLIVPNDGSVSQCES